MAEQNKSNDPRTFQVAMAQSMGMRQEVVTFLEKVSDWKERELYYICAVDGMPLSDMVDLANTKSTIEEIKKKRTEHLRKKYTDLEPIGAEISHLKKEVKEVLAESQSTREIIADNIDAALKKQAEAQEETIRAKNAQIEMLQSRLREVPVAVDDLVQHIEAEDAESLRRSSVFHYIRTQILGRNEMKKFIDTYIKSDRMSSEQKNFLLDCIDEGMDPRDIEKFASPDLSIDMMERIRNLQRK